MTLGRSSSSPSALGAGPGRFVHPPAGVVEQHGPGQRVAVGAQPGAGHAHHRVAGLHRAGSIRSRSTTPTANPTRSKWPGSMRPGCSEISPPPARSRPVRHPPPRRPRSARSAPGRCGRRRCSPGRTAVRPRRRPGRRPTWPHSRCRWCRSGRPGGPPPTWCPPRRWWRPAPAAGSGTGRRRTTRRTRRPRYRPAAVGRRAHGSGSARPPRRRPPDRPRPPDR